MVFQAIIRRYWKVFAGLLVVYFLVVGTYYFTGYGTLKNETGAYLFINGAFYGQAKVSKLRPGTYKVVARSEESEIVKNIVIKPYANTVVTPQKIDLTSIIQKTLNEKTLVVSSGKILNNRWLIALATNDEISKVVVLQWQNGSWVGVTEYVLPESKKSINKDYFIQILPSYVNDYIKQAIFI